MQNKEQLQSLPAAEGYVPEHFQAAVRGINSWKGVAQGLYSFEFTEDPSDADIYVFWTKAFVNNLGCSFSRTTYAATPPTEFPTARDCGRRQAAIQTSRHAIAHHRRYQQSDAAGKDASAPADEFGHALGIEGH